MAYSDRKKRHSRDTTVDSPKNQLNEDSLIAKMKGFQTTDTDMRFDLFANEEKYIDPTNIAYHQRSYDNEPHYSYNDETHNNEYSNNIDDYIKKDDTDSHYDRSDYDKKYKYESEREFESKEEEMHAKLLMLRKLGELTLKGVRLSQNYNMNSDYKTMAMEYELHTGMRKKTNTIRWMGNLMLNLCWGIEMANEHFDPFSIQLKGWSDQLKDDIDEYHDVFDELHEKWFKDGNEIAPELKLMFMLSGSAVKFHMAQSTLSSMPNLIDGLTGDNPRAAKLKEMYQAKKNAGLEEEQKKNDEIIQKMREIEILKARQQQGTTYLQPQNSYMQPPNFSVGLEEHSLMGELMSQKMKLQELEQQLRMQKSDTRSMNSGPVRMKPPTIPISLRNAPPFGNKKVDEPDNTSTDSSVRYNPKLDDILRKSINDNKSIISQMSSVDNDLVSGDTGSKTGGKRRGRKPKTLKIETS